MYVCRFLHFMLGNHGAHAMYGNMPAVFECLQCKSQFKGQQTLKNHKCKYCKGCNIIFSSFQRVKVHKCKADMLLTECVVRDNSNLKGRSQQSVPKCEVKTFNTQKGTLQNLACECKRKACDPPPKASSECQITGMRRPPPLTYNTVDYSWQVKQCNVLGQTVVNIHNSIPQKPIGDPKSLNSVAGDGNCFFRAICYMITGSQDFYESIRLQIYMSPHDIHSIAFTSIYRKTKCEQLPQEVKDAESYHMGNRG